jgi:hypothetical protein
VQATSE